MEVAEPACEGIALLTNTFRNPKLMATDPSGSGVAPPSPERELRELEHGTIVTAAPATVSHAPSERPVVPKASCRNGTLTTRASSASSQAIARFSHRFANGRSSTECRSER